MQSINVAVINPWFLIPFVGTAVVGASLAVWGVVVWGGGEAGWRAVGGALYVFGTFLVTMRCNVPLNDALAAVAPEEEHCVPFDPFAQLPIGSTEVSAISLVHAPVPA